MIRLVPMEAAQFERYLATAVEDYAEVHRKTGDCDPADALPLAKSEYERLLPDGVRSPDQHLFSIEVDGATAPIGMIWFESRERRGRKSAYIYDFQIEPAWRGKGHGAQTLRAVAELVASMGATRLSLNVMGWNQGARALYEKAGFTVTGIGMTKVL